MDGYRGRRQSDSSIWGQAGTLGRILIAFFFICFMVLPVMAVAMQAIFGH